jgi:broad specificity phosphatase PhoE
MSRSEREPVAGTKPRQVILVKHALPVLDDTVPAREWRLGAEGEAQAGLLAQRLREKAPFRLVSSPEPKAARTAEILSAALGLSSAVREGLEEFDRPVLPLLSKPEHAALNAAIFAEPSRRVLGRESGAEALARFSRALAAAVADAPPALPLVAVTHGTVIALLVAAHNSGVDGFDLWKRLTCPSFVVLGWPRLELVEVVEHAA